MLLKKADFFSQQLLVKLAVVSLNEVGPLDAHFCSPYWIWYGLSLHRFVYVTVAVSLLYEADLLSLEDTISF